MLLCVHLINTVEVNGENVRHVLKATNVLRDIYF
jgi:hypothetical protein